MTPSPEATQATPEPTIPCPACGAEWPDAIRYCGECGGRMPDATLVAAPYKVQVEATDAMPAGVIPEELVPTLVPPSNAPHADEDGVDPGAPLLDMERLEEASHASALMVAPDPATLPAVSTIGLDVIGEAWRIVARRKGPFAVGTLVVGLASSALGATAVGSLALGPVQGGLAVVGLRAASGRKVHLDDFFSGIRSWDLALRLAITWLLCSLAIAIGSLLLVVPGLYVAMATSYAPLLVVDRGMQPVDAIRMSVAHVNARLGSHAALFAALAGLLFVASLPCGLGLLLAVPVAVVTVALCYARVFGIRLQ